MPRIKDQAIPIRHLDWSETSQIVVLLTREHGKIRGLAKGAKRMTPSSIERFSGGVELLTRGEIVFVQRAGSDLATLTEWDLQDDYHHLRTDLAAHRLAMYAADVCGAVLADADPHPRTFDALGLFLDRLRDDDAAKRRSLLGFQWGLLEDAGFRPELFQDAATGGELPPPAGGDSFTFDPKAGGLTAAARLGAGDWRVRPATVDLLRRVAQAQGVDGAPPEAVDRANRLLCAYLRALLDQQLPTMRFVLSETS